MSLSAIPFRSKVTSSDRLTGSRYHRSGREIGTYVPILSEFLLRPLRRERTEMLTGWRVVEAILGAFGVGEIAEDAGTGRTTRTGPLLRFSSAYYLGQRSIALPRL